MDSLRDSSLRSTRQNNGIAPHARGESSSSPSYSENNDFISSIKKTDVTTNNKSDKQLTKQSNSLRSEVNVIKHEIDSGRMAGNVCAEPLNQLNNYVVTSSSNAIGRKRKDLDCTDDVDSAKQNNKFNPFLDKQPMFTGESSVKGNSITSFSSSSSSSSSVAKSENFSSPEVCFSMPTSPASLSTPIVEALPTMKQKEVSNSVPTSPESGTQDIVLRRNQQPNSVVRKCDVSGFRTSRSEDHLQHTQRDIMGAIVQIDVDEDVNSSLNTLLDTRDDSEETQVSCKCF